MAWQAAALLEAAGIELESNRIRADESKKATLVALRQKHADQPFAFVDDSVNVLRAVANELPLFGAELYFAQWGYSTAQQEALAAAMPRLRTLGPESNDLGRALRGED